MEKLEKRLSSYWLPVVLIYCIPAVWALLVPGFYGASDEVHIAWLYEMDQVIKLGQIPPRFVPDLSFGYGYPLFNFVFPLPFYIGEIFHLLGASFVDSIKLVFLFSVPVSAVFMFFLLKKLTSNSLALLGSMLYVYAPYRSVDLYVRGAIGEIVAFIFFPLITLSILEVTERKPSWKFIGIGALALGGLVLTHNIAMYMFFPFVLLLGLMRSFINKQFLALVLLVGGGLLISSYFWVPALTESSLMKYDTVFNFTDHFPTLKQLVTPYWGYGASVPGPYDGLSFFLGYFSVLLLGLSVPLLITFWKRIEGEKKAIVFWALFGILISVFMMNFRSAFFWERLPLLPYFQFPWRFLMMTTFFIPILVVLLEKISFKYLQIIFSLLAVLIVIVSFPYFRPQDFLGRQDEYFLKKYVPVPNLDPLYLMQQEEYLRLPVGTNTRPSKYEVFLLENGKQANVSIERINGLGVLLQTNSADDFKFSYNKYFFPGWEALIDGKKVLITGGSPYGQIQFDIPSGKHQVSINFKETSFRLIFDLISLVGLLIAILIIWKYRQLTKN